MCVKVDSFDSIFTLKLCCKLGHYECSTSGASVRVILINAMHERLCPCICRCVRTLVCRSVSLFFTFKSKTRKRAFMMLQLVLCMCVLEGGWYEVGG